MKRLIVAVLLVLAAAGLNAYEPLSSEEAKAYIAAAGEEAVVADIIKLDAIEHAVPTVTFPMYELILVDGTDLVVAYFPKYIAFDIDSYLSYEIKLEDKTVRGFVSRARWGPAVIGILAGCLTSTVLEAVLPLGPFIKEGSAAGGGAIVGLGLYFLLR